MKNLTHQEVQQEELNILLEFDRLCQKNHLRYSLAGGTLLGAVRHKGFIPWDDDIDVCMPRPDYEKLIEIFNDQANTELFFLSPTTEKMAPYPYIKMQFRNVMIEEKGFNEVENLWIDIFPVDGLPEERRKLISVYRKSTFYRKLIIFDKWKSVQLYGGRHSKLVASGILLFVRLYGNVRAVRNSIKLAKKYKYEDSKYVGAVTWGCYGIGERMLKSEYEKLVDVEFEGHTFKAMSCWDSYLTGIYGDYMQLPPEDKRVCHGFKAYRIEENE